MQKREINARRHHGPGGPGGPNGPDGGKPCDKPAPEGQNPDGPPEQKRHTIVKRAGPIKTITMFRRALALDDLD
jgi:hypothetical protein